MGRVATALLVAAAGGVHLYLWFDYFHRVHVVGTLFLVNAGVGIVIGAALLVRGGAVTVLAAGAYALGTLAAFAVSTHWGLFGYRESFWGSWQEAAGGIELAAALLVAAALRGGRRPRDLRTVRNLLSEFTDSPAEAAVDTASTTTDRRTP